MFGIKRSHCIGLTPPLCPLHSNYTHPHSTSWFTIARFGSFQSQHPCVNFPLFPYYRKIFCRIAVVQHKAVTLYCITIEDTRCYLTSLASTIILLSILQIHFTDEQVNIVLTSPKCFIDPCHMYSVFTFFHYIFKKLCFRYLTG